MQRAHFQSIVGVGETDFGLLEAQHLGRKQQQDRPAVVQWNGWKYLVGAGVEHYARPVERMDFQRLSDGVELRALTYRTWFELLHEVPAAQRTVAIMVGLPVEVMQNAEIAKRTLRNLRRWMQGTHTFSVDGKAITVTVTRVGVLAQPAGAYYAWGFDDQGHWARSRADQTTAVGIADIGFNTLDLFTVQGGRIQGRWTGGDSLGMRRAAELVGQAVRRSHGLTLSKHQADALLREPHPERVVAGKTVDLTHIVEQARSTNAASILTFLEEHWGTGQQFGYTLFTGGGAEALRDVLREHYPHGTILPEAVLTNALGLARAGRRSLGRYADTIIGLDPGFGGFKAVLL